MRWHPNEKRIAKNNEQLNIMKRIRSRELAGMRESRFQRNLYQKFNNFKLKTRIDTVLDVTGCPNKLPSLILVRSEIIELFSVTDLIFSLSKAGVASVFNKDTGKCICILNQSTDEVIRSLFHNTHNKSIVTVSARRSESYRALHCTSTLVEYIRRGKAGEGKEIFEEEQLAYPAFVEFDSLNSSALTFSSHTNTYKIWTLTDYEYLYSIKKEPNISEIKMSPGVILVIYKREQSSISLKILNVKDGSEMASLAPVLFRGKRVEFIEQFDHKLLIKQQKRNLRILDIETKEVIEVMNTQLFSPSAFIFLSTLHLFMTFGDRNISIWNFKGEKVTEFEDHTLWHKGAKCNTNNIFVTNKHDIIISFCLNGASCFGSINISDIVSGACLGKIASSASIKQDDLQGITSIFYDEDYNAIYTGNKIGQIIAWAN